MSTFALMEDKEFLLKIVVGLGALIAPITPVMWTIVFLISCDFATGIYAAYKSGKRIESSKMGRTVSKFFFYLLVILAGHTTEIYIFPEIPLMRVVSGFIALTELRSLFENFNTIYGIDIWDKVKGLFDKKA